MERKFIVKKKSSEYHYENGNAMVITLFSYKKSDNNLVRIEVLDRRGERKFFKNIRATDDASIAVVNHPYDYDFMELESVKGFIRSIEDTICSIDFDNLPKQKHIVDYGWTNGWKKGESRPLDDKYIEDCKNNRYTVAYITEKECGRCCRTYTNWTYGYKYSVDSSD